LVQIKQPKCADSLGSIKFTIVPSPPSVACGSYLIILEKQNFPTNIIIRSRITSFLTDTFGNLPPSGYNIRVVSQCANPFTGFPSDIYPFPINFVTKAAATSTPYFPSCFGQIASINIDTIKGGTPFNFPQVGTKFRYNFFWDNNLFPNTDSVVLLPGPHSLTIIDSFGCISVDTNFRVPNIKKISPKDTVLPVKCHNDCNAQISVVSSNAVPPIQYQLINGITGAPLAPFGSSNTFPNLCADSTYQIIVKDNNNCIDTTKKIKIFNPPILKLDTANKVDLRCLPGCDGRINLIPSGGLAFQPGNYYKIKVLKGPTDSLKIFKLSANVPYLFDSLCAGNYEVEIRDSLGCIKSALFQIKPPTNPLKIKAYRTNIKCKGDKNGIATVKILSGQAPFTYSWVKVPAGPVGCTISTPSADSIFGLCPGKYVVTVTDSFLCVKRDTVIITEPDSLKIKIKTSSNPKCYGDNNGAITVSTTGGTKPYTFSWNGGSFVLGDSIRINLLGVPNTIIVKDSNLCTATITKTLVNPDSISIKFALKRETCAGLNNGSATVLASGGTRPFTYAWAPSTTFALADSTRLNSLAPNIYSVTVKDFNACQKTASFTILPALPFSVNLFVSKPNCSGTSCDGVLKVTPIGGKPNITYAWSNITLSNPGVAIPNPPLVDSIKNLCSGIYKVIATDSNNCVAMDIDTIKPAIKLVVTITSGPLTCASPNSGSATATVTNGNPNFTIVWKKLPSTTINTTIGAISSITGLNTGTYVATVTDFYGCVTSDTAKFLPPPKVSFKLTASKPTCFGGNNGSVAATFITGKPPFSTVKWSRITAPSAILFQNTVPFPSVPGINGLISGTYQLYVVDANGCDSTFNAIVKDTNKIVILDSISKQPDCNANPNLQNGTIKLSISGGTLTAAIPNYKIRWREIISGTNYSAFDNLTTIIGVGPGTYRAIVEDAAGCKDSSFTTLSNPASIRFTVQPVNALCYNTKSGSIAIVNGKMDVLPGTLTIFNITSGSAVSVFTQVITTGTFLTSSPLALTKGNYIVRAVDGLGCIKDTAITISATPPILANPTLINPKCNNEANGQILIQNTSPSPTGGNGGPWLSTIISGPVGFAVPAVNNPSTPATNLIGGLYKYYIQDKFGCRDTFSASLINPTILSGTFTLKNPIKCFGDTNGVGYITPTGGTPPYTNFGWPNGTTSDTAYNLASDTFNLVFFDANACPATVLVQISQPNKIIPTLKIDSAICFGANTGKVQVLSVTGGNPPFVYNWAVNPPTTSNASTITNLFAGNYVLKITETISGCVSNNNFSIKSNPQIKIALNLSKPICFGDSTGNAIALVTGGTGLNTYNYLWQNTGNLSAVYLNSATATPKLQADTFKLTVTDAKACFDDTMFIMKDPTKIDANLFIKSPLICKGDSNAVVISKPSGGTGSKYNFSWTKNNIFKQTKTNQKGDTLFSGFGKIVVTVTDSVGCNIKDSVTVSDAAVISVLTSVISKAKCDSNKAVGSVKFTITGGLLPYSYVWTLVTGASPTKNPLPNMGNAILVGTSVFIEDSLGPGPYYLNITDANGCKVAPPIVVEPSSINSPKIDSIRTYNNTCFGFASGSAAIFLASGGTKPYSYTWLDPFNAFIQPANVATDSVAGLKSGKYKVVIIDSTGCSSLDTFSIKSPNKIKVTMVTAKPKCKGINDGSITITKVVGTGTGGFTYQLRLNPSGTFFGPNNGPNGFNLLATGSYTLRITDGASCVQDSIFFLSPATEIKALISTSDINCFGDKNGAVLISNVNGGLAPYSYQWNDPSGQANTVANNLAAGIYSVTITDNQGCKETFTDTVMQTPQITATISITNTVCKSNVGAISVVNVSGGKPAYKYRWNTNTNTSSISGLFAGVYTVTISDQFNCSRQFTASVNDVNGPQVVASKTNIICNGANNGTASVAITGKAPFIINWLPQGISTVTNITNVAPGNYVVQVKDSNGCIGSDTFAITQPAPLALNPISTASGCSNLQTGKIELFVSGGIGPYSYNWAVPVSSTTAIANNLKAGIYKVTVNDNVGCSSTQFVAVNSSNGPVATLTKKDQLCATGTTGFANLNVTGGTTPYTYTWNGPSGVIGGNASNVTNLGPNNYAYAVADANQCIAAGIFTVKAGVSPQLSIPRIVTPKCFDSCNASIAHIISAGSLPYSIQWSNGATQVSSINKLCAGKYTITVTDSNQCVVARTDSFANPLPLKLSVVVDSVVCPLDVNGKITATVTGGTPNYNYNWSKGTGTGNICTNLNVGLVNLFVTDANGCKADTSLTLTPEVIIQPNAGPDIKTCPDQTVPLSAISNVPAETFFWYNTVNGVIGSQIGSGKNITVQTFKNVYLVTYILEVRNKTCKAFDTVQLILPEPLTDAGPDKEIVLGGNVNIGGNPTGPISTNGIPTTYAWTPDDFIKTADLPNPNAAPLKTTNYVVAVTHDGCTFTDTMRLTVVPTIIVPSGVTPNGDGLNDTWVLSNIEKFPNNVVEIFNRWGEQLYIKKGYNNVDGWNGKYNGQDLPVGTYYFVIKLNDPIFPNPITGPLTILR
jgi:large repetitive protein